MPQRLRRCEELDEMSDDSLPDMNYKALSSAAPPTAAAPAATPAAPPANNWLLAIEVLLGAADVKRFTGTCTCPFTRTGLGRLYKIDQQRFGGQHYPVLRQEFGLPPNPLSPHTAEGGSSPCTNSGKDGGFTCTTLQQHSDKVSDAIARAQPSRRDDYDASSRLHLALSVFICHGSVEDKYLACQPLPKRASQASQGFQEQMAWPPMLFLSGLPRADPPHLQDLSQEALDGLSADETQKLAPNSADRLSKKYRKFGPSMCVPAFNWQGFKGEAVLVFQHAASGHMVGFDHACNLEDELASGGGVGCRFLSLSEYEKLKDQVWAKQKLKKLTAESVFKAEKKKDRAEQVKQLTVESAKRESENTALRAQNEKVGEALQKKEELLKELTVAFEDQVKRTVEMERHQQEQQQAHQVALLRIQQDAEALDKTHTREVVQLIAQKNEQNAIARRAEQELKQKGEEAQLLRAKQKDHEEAMNEVLAAAESDVQRVRRQAEEEQAKLQSSASAATAAKLAEEQAKFEELQRKYALEVKTMKSELEDKDAEVVAARAEDEVHNKEQNRMIGDLDNMKEGYHLLDGLLHELIDGKTVNDQHVPGLLADVFEQKRGHMTRPLPDEQQTSRFYVREFGHLSMHEAHDLGINVQEDFAYTTWTTYDQGTQTSPLVEAAKRDRDGRIIGYREVKETLEYKPFLKPNGEYFFRPPQVKDVPEFVEYIKKKYRGGSRAKKILQALVDMHNDYLEYPGNGYSVSRRFWSREFDREMKHVEKVRVLAELHGGSTSK